MCNIWFEVEAILMQLCAVMLALLLCRGICYFCVEVQCAGSDLHSGIHGGVM